MCPDLSDEWVADTKRRRKIRVFGPVAWYAAVALSAVAIATFIAAYLVVLFRLGGRGAWPVVAIVLASIGFVVAVPAALAWISRKTRIGERASRHSVSNETEHSDAWLGGLAPQHDVLEHSPGDSRGETDHRAKRTRFQWIMVPAFILIVLGLMLFFRSIWIP
jgi:hypothetical protein